jgi:hypothetical protein
MNMEVGAPPKAAQRRPSSAVPPSRRRWWQHVALVLFATGGVVGLLTLMHSTPPNGDAQVAKPNNAPPKQFDGWDNPPPVLALMLTGQQYGYNQPCGCSSPQYGGVVRRYNFLQSLRKKGWPVVALDVGDMAQKDGPQRALKYATTMKALNLMNYKAVGIGYQEFSMPLVSALAEYSLNNPMPRLLASNILTPKTQQVIRDVVQGWSLIPADGNGAPAIGVIGLVGTSVAKDVDKKVKDPDIGFHGDNAAVLRKALDELKGKTQFAVLLYQGLPTDAEICAKFCAAERRKNHALPELRLILCHSPWDVAPNTPQKVEGAPNTWIVTVGHKGRDVGVVGVFRSQRAGQPYELRYERVAIGPEYETPKGQEMNNPIIALMAEYAREVKDGQYILKYPTSPHPVQVTFKDAKYVGSERCAGCHPDAYKIWEKSKHALAYKTLETIKQPPFRHYDGECVSCHTVGFNHLTGYADALRGDNKGMIKKLQSVGCESCHGPCSEHVKDKNNMLVRAAINPFKAATNGPPGTKERLQLKLNVFCQTCHDSDNDVHWKFDKNWPQVVHMTPRNNAAQQPAGNGNNGNAGHPATGVGTATSDQQPVIGDPPQPIVTDPPMVNPQQGFPPGTFPPQQVFPPGTVPPQQQPPANTQQPSQRRFYLNPFRWFQKSSQ